MIGDYDELMNSDLNKITRACLLVAHTFTYICGQDNSIFSFQLIAKVSPLYRHLKVVQKI